MRVVCFGILGALATLGASGSADADGTLLSEDTWDFAPGGDVVVDAGLVVGLPAALPTGMAMGVGIGFMSGRGLAWGARIEGLTATESSIIWTVTDRELRLRALGAVTTTAGRGTIGLRLGVGGDLVHETRVRNQGMRAGLSGSQLENRALAMVPAVDLALAIELHVAGHWLLELAGGPTVDVVDRSLHPGWSTELGVGWRP